MTKRYKQSDVAVLVEPVDIDGHDVYATSVPHRQRFHELENAGRGHQEQSSAQVQVKKSHGGLHG